MHDGSCGEGCKETLRWGEVTLGPLRFICQRDIRAGGPALVLSLLSSHRRVSSCSFYLAPLSLATVSRSSSTLLYHLSSLNLEPPSLYPYTMASKINIINPTTAAASSATTSVYGTTPGGTARLSYTRDQLLQLASSPLSRSPPAFEVPAAISRTPKVDRSEEEQFAEPHANANGQKVVEDAESDDEAFKMDL